MAVNVADLHLGIIEVWTTSGLTAEVQKYWAEDERTRYPALHEGMATPGNPFPYVVWEHLAGTIVSRDSGVDPGVKRHIRDYQVQFKVVAENTEEKSAKQIAAELADLIMQKYGGHPSQVPQQVNMDCCEVLISQYINDFPARLDEEQYMWTIQYNFRVDVAVKVRNA